LRIYIDSSALVKLVLVEAESEALNGYLERVQQMVCSRVGEIEFRRIALRNAYFDEQRVDEVSRRLDYRELSKEVATLASRLGPPTLRTRDAIHLAPASELATELDAFVTYDARLAQAAELHGLRVASPS
jgi:predicted nucleic acid-binding protein